MLNYKLVGEVYGVFSKVCFMIDSGRYDVTDKLIDAYEVASRDLENGSINEESLQVLLDFITDNTNSNYWIDFDEPLFIDDEDDDDFEEYACPDCGYPCKDTHIAGCSYLDEDDECSDEEDEELDIDLDEVKHWAKQIGKALNEMAQESINKSDKPIKIEIVVKED